VVAVWGATEVPYPSTVTVSRPLALVLGDATERAVNNSVSLGLPAPLPME